MINVIKVISNPFFPLYDLDIIRGPKPIVKTDRKTWSRLLTNSFLSTLLLGVPG